MLKEYQHFKKIYIATGFTDPRKGIDGLAGLVQEQFQLDVFEDTLFLFCGRRNDRIKGLYWDTNGFLLLYKRLEAGRFRWPRSMQEALQISVQQYEWLCDGIEIVTKRGIYIDIFPLDGLGNSKNEAK